jgi:hypothetical protein
VYPKGYSALVLTASNGTDVDRYVDLLEQQQTQLVAGLRELYSRLQKRESWPGQPLRESSGGYPLTHDILERLDLLHPSSHNISNYEGFEEDFEQGALFTRRRGSVSSDSEQSHASSKGTPTTQLFPFSTLIARHNAPPTSPMNILFPRQSQIVSPVKQESPLVSSQFMNTSASDLSAVSQTVWLNDSTMMDELMDFSNPIYGFDNFGYDQNVMIDTIEVNPNDAMMPDWNSNAELDFSSFIQNPNSV